MPGALTRSVLRELGQPAAAGLRLSLGRPADEAPSLPDRVAGAVRAEVCSAARCQRIGRGRALLAVSLTASTHAQGVRMDEMRPRNLRGGSAFNCSTRMVACKVHVCRSSPRRHLGCLLYTAASMLNACHTFTQ